MPEFRGGEPARYAKIPYFQSATAIAATTQMFKQRTLKSVIRATGVGLHTGEKVAVTLRPASPDVGIVFRRIDLPVPIDIVADAFKVTDARLCSALEANGAKVATVEHLMSAFGGSASTTPTSISRGRKFLSWTGAPRLSCFSFSR